MHLPSLPIPEVHVDTNSPGCGEFAIGLIVVILVIAALGFSTGAIPQVLATLVSR